MAINKIYCYVTFIYIYLFIFFILNIFLTIMVMRTGLHRCQLQGSFEPGLCLSKSAAL